MGGHHLDYACTTAADGDVCFAGWVPEFGECGAGDEDGEAGGEAEDGCGGVALGDGAEDAGVEEEAREGAGVFAAGCEDR